MACVAACGGDATTSQPREAAARVEVTPRAEGARSASPSCATRPARQVTLSRDVEPILMSGCSGEYCHALAMTSPSRAYAFLVNQPSLECDDLRPLVTPRDPERSYLVDKLLGRNLCTGHPMPRGLENRLSPEEVGIVSDWICEGAPND